MFAFSGANLRDLGGLMTLLLDKPGAPGTHAIVIGVGRYDWLIGGKQGSSTYSDGMGQLSSPPVSATRFASWLLDT